MKYEIEQTAVFNKWFKKLKDRRAYKAIAVRMFRAQQGNLGDIAPIGDGLSEMRIFVGKGYRVYFAVKGNKLILLLNGGDKSTQSKDIKQAKLIFEQLEE